MSAHGGPDISTNNLVLHLDAGNSKSYPGSGTTWFDLSGRGNHGTLTNGPIFNSERGGSIVFDGVNDFVSTSTTTIDLTQGYTVNIIAKWTNNSMGIFQINGGSQYINLYIAADDVIRWETYFGSSMNTGFSSPTNKITHIAATFSGVTSVTSGTAKMYINGNLLNTATTNSGPSVTAPFRLGEYAGYMNGSIYMCSFYNRTLSAAEVQQNFNAMRVRYGI